jgi:hypothetical protein
VTRDETRFLLGRIGAAYGRRPPTANVLDEWERALRRYPATEAHATLDQLIDSGDPGPSLPQFLAHLRARHPNVEGPRVVPNPPDDGPPGTGPTQRGKDLIEWVRSRLDHPTANEPPPR